MENQNNGKVKEITADQQQLIAKVLKSRKFKDKEYRQLRNILDNQVVTRYDASIFIDYVLATLKFRRNFLNGKHKAYKRCYYCKSRDNVQRYALAKDLKKKEWICGDCALNLRGEVVPVKDSEDMELKADLASKYPEDSSVRFEE